MEKVLLIGRVNDPHILGIQSELKNINQNFYTLDSFSFEDSFQIKYPVSKNELQTKNQKIFLDEIKSVWNSNALKIQLNQELIDDSREFVQNEWHEGISSLWNSIDGVWVNDPESILLYGNRLKQLQLAHELGLRIPETLITNNPDEFTDFYSEHQKNIIAKTLNSSVGLPEGKMIFTTKIKDLDIQRKDEIRNAPSMFQEYVPKKTEFRTTIIGNVIHSVEIHSQKSTKTKHDWRNYDDFKKHHTLSKICLKTLTLNYYPL